MGEYVPGVHSLGEGRDGDGAAGLLSEGLSISSTLLPELVEARRGLIKELLLFTVSLGVKRSDLTEILFLVGLNITIESVEVSQCPLTTSAQLSLLSLPLTYLSCNLLPKLF